ncbi:MULTISPECIES: hypothetical protein [Bacillaceae]|uniref:Uncharacterized protein n=4 Tax=Bacillus TaxID=1386 RepID=U5LBP2_9BACI|nr:MULTISPECIES: hypothetical protein [Bacillus]AGX04865.1 hypothetical protein N288_14825 [Bacillus infantis NRRL B-14911]EAR68046.1 hypothetical protein B14911_25345 [Bacillus sp. NRRL B-14911]MCA1035264.1 hypothetical protein [Bacillus infantis]MDW2877923.1 hypothetical protein [Bacillus infantis]PLR74925.1 hypothetical protein CYJ37_04755 [Bacillus sp. UMB0728]
MRYFSPLFKINSIHIGSIEDASCVNFGNSFPSGFTSLKKHNQGFGNVLGDHNDIHDIMSRLEEKDVTEVFHKNGGEEIPEWIGKLLQEDGEEENMGMDEEENDGFSETGQ